jgi:hypothetical protein
MRSQQACVDLRFGQALVLVVALEAAQTNLRQIRQTPQLRPNAEDRGVRSIHVGCCRLLHGCFVLDALGPLFLPRLE